MSLVRVLVAPAVLGALAVHRTARFVDDRLGPIGLLVYSTVGVVTTLLQNQWGWLTRLVATALLAPRWGTNDCALAGFYGRRPDVEVATKIVTVLVWSEIGVHFYRAVIKQLWHFIRLASRNVVITSRNVTIPFAAAAVVTTLFLLSERFMMWIDYISFKRLSEFMRGADKITADRLREVARCLDQISEHRVREVIRKADEITADRLREVIRGADEITADRLREVIRGADQITADRLLEATRSLDQISERRVREVIRGADQITADRLLEATRSMNQISEDRVREGCFALTRIASNSVVDLNTISQARLEESLQVLRRVQLRGNFLNVGEVEVRADGAFAPKPSIFQRIGSFFFGG